MTVATGRKRPKFKNPPVVELVCGTLFATLPALSAPLAGAYWTRIRDGFPRLETVAPLLSSVEEQGDTPQRIIELGPIPPIRTWMLTEDQTRLIQIQPDRFIYNWKSGDGAEPYPSYEIVIGEFEKQYREFREFLTQEKIGSPRLRQFELTYVDHVLEQSVASIPGGLEAVLVDHAPSRSKTRFSPTPEAFVWRWTVPLPDSLGRLYITAQTAKRSSDGAKLLRLDCSAKGVSGDVSDQGMRAWFDMAHDFIGQTFLDITSERVQQEIWQPEQ